MSITSSENGKLFEDIYFREEICIEALPADIIDAL